MKRQVIDLVTTRFKKDNLKWIEQDKYSESITENEYNNFVNSKGFFTKIGAYERHKKNYTNEGYIVTEIHTISPDKTEKIIREFIF